MPSKGYKQTKEHILKCIKHKLGKKNPMFGVHRFGSKNPFYGRKHTINSIQKMRLSKMGKGHLHTKETKNKCAGD